MLRIRKADVACFCAALCVLGTSIALAPSAVQFSLLPVVVGVEEASVSLSETRKVAYAEAGARPGAPVGAWAEEEQQEEEQQQQWLLLGLGLGLSLLPLLPLLSLLPLFLLFQLRLMPRDDSARPRPPSPLGPEADVGISIIEFAEDEDVEGWRWAFRRAMLAHVSPSWCAPGTVVPPLLVLLSALLRKLSAMLRAAAGSFQPMSRLGIWNMTSGDSHRENCRPLQHSTARDTKVEWSKRQASGRRSIFGPRAQTEAQR